MNWTTTLIIAAVVAVIFMMKKSGQISAKDALEKLKDGALVIDARSPGEFNSGHLAKAINIPVDEIEMALPKRVKDKKSLAAALPKRNAERRGETEIERHGLRERLQPRLVWPGERHHWQSRQQIIRSSICSLKSKPSFYERTYVESFPTTA